MFGNKKKISGLIYAAEEEALISKTSVTFIYRELAQELKWLDPKKADISLEIDEYIRKRLENSISPTEVYRQYLPKETIILLEEIRNRGGDIGSVLILDRPIRDIANDLNASIQNKLKTPLITGVIVLFIMQNLLDGFSEMIHDPTVEASALAISISDHFYFYAVPPLALIALIAFTRPQWIPGVGGVIKKISNMLIVSTARLLSEQGASSVEIIPFLEKSFKLKRSTPSLEIRDLSKMLYENGCLREVEAAILAKVKFSSHELPPLFERFTNNRKKEALAAAEVVEGLIANFSIILILIPFAIAGYAIGNAIFSMISKLNL